MTSPTEDENVDNNKDILCVKNIDTQKTGDPEKQEGEEHSKLEEEIPKDGTNSRRKLKVPGGLKTQKTGRSHGDPRT